MTKKSRKELNGFIADVFAKIGDVPKRTFPKMCPVCGESFCVEWVGKRHCCDVFECALCGVEIS